MCTIQLILFLLIFCTFEQRLEAELRVIKYVYQKDMSEHCRRRVMPSVFISNNVVEANSQILRFSQLDVPYSCFISIRTETGGNIILVIQTDSNPEGCSKDNEMESPVKVFSMGETFGGYWGPLPDSILSTNSPEKERFYTRKKARITLPSKNKDELPEELLYDDDKMTTHKEEHHKTWTTNGDSEEDYIRQMIPIVNITGRLVESDKEPSRAFAADDTFDLFYDVQRKPGESYLSTVVPLIQFSAGDYVKAARTRQGEAADGRKQGGDNNVTTPEPLFDLEYDFGGFTLDPRLILPSSKSHVLGKKYRPYVNRRLDFKHKKPLFSAQRTSTNQYSKDDIFGVPGSYIQGLLANLTNNNLEQIEKENESENERFSALLQRFSDWQHNYSAYLAPNMTLDDPLFLRKHKENLSENLKSSTLVYSRIETNEDKLSISTKNDLNKEISTLNYLQTDISTRLIKVSAGTRAFLTTPKAHGGFADIGPGVTSPVPKVAQIEKTTIYEVADLTHGVTKQISELGSKITKNSLVTDTSRNTDIYTESSISSSYSTQKESLEELTIKPTSQAISLNAGTIADHASWENVVQLAPRIAGMLETTKPSDENAQDMPLTSKRHKRVARSGRRRRRRKRYIQAVAVEPARPHSLTANPDVATTPEPMYNFLDMQDFAQLVELQDDEIQGHVALRYMRRYVGATMFDLCSNVEKHDKRTQHVLFFNTSRIVLALNNFTLQRMTVIATPARWLPYASQRCGTNSLECQVAGKRCCVNQLVACDGVPNCGALDIYDEDRLLCGADSSLNHNVYLAAFTFLAALLTMLYTVHYWLKRCVPKVSEAFFIYTDGTENTLYLDSIMRSPLGDDDDKLTYQGIPYFESVFTAIKHRKKISFFNKVFPLCWRRKKKIDDFELEDVDVVDSFNEKQHRQTFSFAEMELNQFTKPSGVEIAVQTGASLEMRRSIEDPVEFKNITTPHMRENSINIRSAFPDIRLNYEPQEEVTWQTSEDTELNMLKFLKEAKQAALFREDSEKERELKNTMYDRNANQSDLTTASLKLTESISDLLLITPDESHNLQQSLPLPGPSNLPTAVSRRIRFNDTTRAISHDFEDHDIEDNEVSPEVDPISAGTGGRDFMRFFTPKGKKDKQKQRKQLQMHLNK